VRRERIPPPDDHVRRVGYLWWVNKNGTEANLVPAQFGNTNALKHGVHSERVIDALAAKIEDELFGELELSPYERIAVSEVARLLAILQLVDLALDQYGILDRKGQPTYLLALRARYTRELRTWRAELPAAAQAQPDVDGGTPTDRAALIQQLKRIALGHDRTARPGEQLTAIQMLFTHGTDEAQPLDNMDFYIQQLMQQMEDRAVERALASVTTPEEEARIRAYFAENPFGDPPAISGGS
jgi:hypothetical protein